MKTNLLKNIKSKFIFNKVFDYIGQNKKLQIFKYTKYFQEILGIKIFDYQQIYFNKKGIKLDDLNKFFSPKYHIINNYFNKDILKNNLLSFLNDNDISYNSLKSYIFEYYKNLTTNLNNENKTKILIDIYSPFFDDLLENGYIELFTIPIEMNIIEKYQLYNDYIIAWEKLNKSNSNLSIIINFKNERDITLLKDFNINFEKIKNLDMINIGNEKNINYNNLLKNIFSLNNFGKNLINLNLKIHDIWSKITDLKLFEKFNNFQKLKTLELNGFNFENNFILNINNLISLNLRNSTNIILSKNNKLKYLLISNCNILKNESLIKLENLEKCELLNYKNNQKYHEILDFTSFSNLKFINCEICDFIHLADITPLENANINSTIDNNAEIEKSMIEKICKLKKLKEVSFDIYNINLEVISNINYKNSSLNKMCIHMKNEFQNANFYGLINKFENLLELNLEFQGGEEYFESNLKIIENDKCKINKFSISGCGVHNIELYCGPYSNLNELKLDENGKISNLKDSFPLFQNNCQIKFDKLNNFTFINKELSIEPVPFEVLNNLYNNLNKIQNLKNIYINCYSSEMNKEFYEKFIKKLLEMKLDSITFEVQKMGNEEINDLNDFYKLEELKEIYPLVLTDKKYNINKNY